MQEFTRKYKLRLLLIIVMFLGNLELIYAHHPHDIIDTLELSPSYDQDQMLFIKHSDHIRKSTDGGASWKELANGLDHKHNLSAIAISPSFHVDQTLFISSDGDGIYKSQNMGSSWVKVNKGLKNLRIRSLSIYPNYAAEHVVLAAGTNRGLYRTDNGGESWEQVMAENIKITAIVFLNGEAKKHVLAGDQHGSLYISNNGGRNWRQYFQILGSGAITAIAVSPNISVDDTLFVGTEEQGIFKTTNRGVSFEKVKEFHRPVISLGISPDYATDSTIFASTWDEAVYISTNGGKTWKQYGAGLTTDKQADSVKYRSPHFTDVKLSNTFGRDKVVFLGGFDGLFKSTDAGHSWRQLETLPVRLIKGLAVSQRNGDEFLIGLATYGGGCYVTADRGRTWRISNVGLHKTRLSDVVFSPNYRSDHTLFSGEQGVLLQSTDGGDTWNRIPLRHRSWRTLLSSGLRRLGFRSWSRQVLTPAERRSPYPTRIAPSPNFAVDNALYFGTRWHGIYKSVDGGQTSVPIWDSSGKAVLALVISPDFPSDKTLFASIIGHGIYKTVDGGETWEAVNNGLTSTNNQAPGFVHQITKKKIILTISPHYKADQTVFAGCSEGLYKTRDGGKSWLKVDNLIYGRNAYIIGVGISPNYENDQTLLISVKGRGLFKSEDGGTTFVHIAPDLIEANHAIESIAFSSSYPSDNTIYAASDEEMFRSSDGGNTWTMIARPVRYENMREPIHYKGAWELQGGEDFSASSINYSDVAGDEAMLSFVGSGVTWIGTTSPNQGIARVYIDGEHQGDVDQFSDTGETLVEAYSISGLTYGPHSIRVEIANDKNPKSTGYRIEIDAFDVKPGIEKVHKE